MKKVILALFAASVLVVSCKKDDDHKQDPPRDRGEEAIAAQNEIEEFLSNYAYNYEDFENPVEDFDYRILMDSIVSGSDKTPLIEQVEYKTVEDPYDSDVKYKLYYLNIEQGEGTAVEDAEVAYITFETWQIPANELLDLTNSSQPQRLVMDKEPSNTGLKEVLKEFNAANGHVENEDGTVDYEGYGIGAVFVPSGLAYFNNPPLSLPIGPYSQIVYTFQVKGVSEKEDEVD